MLVKVTIDHITIQNAEHFASKKEKGPAAMIADGFVPGNNEQEKLEWATKAQAACVKAVEEAAGGDVAKKKK